MNAHPLSQDPAQERTGSAVFVPLDSSLVRQLAQAEVTGRNSPLFSEPSDDLSDRRYSDVSVATTIVSERRSSPETAELIRQWNLRVRDTDLRQEAPPAMRDRARDTAPRSFGQPASFSSNGLSPSVSRLWEETLPSGSRRAEERKRSNIPTSTGAYEPKRYEFYGVGVESNPGYYSTPYFSLQPARPEPIRPIVQPEPQRKRMSGLWKFLSGRRKSRRERKSKDAARFANLQPPTVEPAREKREWKTDTLRRLRRSGRHATDVEDILAEEKVQQRQNDSKAVDCQYSSGHARRARSSTRSSCSSITAEPQNIPSTRVFVGDSPSLGALPLTKGERPGAYFDSKREANSFAGYRGRIMFGTEGSSVSSSSDREEENNAESSHLYLSVRQLRAMQYK